MADREGKADTVDMVDTQNMAAGREDTEDIRPPREPPPPQRTPVPEE
jgi:hypothetical protein